jgi:hypothetical protein
VALIDLPLTKELTDKGILIPPVILPSFLTDVTGRRRLGRVASDDGLHDLIGADT